MGMTKTLTCDQCGSHFDAALPTGSTTTSGTCERCSLDFRRAMTRLQSAASEVVEKWIEEDVTLYPPELPSFDELAASINGIEIGHRRPADTAETPRLRIITPTDPRALEHIFGADEENEVHPLGEIPQRLQERLDELAKYLPHGAKIMLARDWERCVFGLVDYNGTQADADWPGFDCLAFTETGRVGFGGVNMPRYFDTVAELVDDHRERAAAPPSTCDEEPDRWEDRYPITVEEFDEIERVLRYLMDGAQRDEFKVEEFTVRPATADDEVSMVTVGEICHYIETVILDDGGEHHTYTAIGQSGTVYKVEERH